MKSNRDTPWVLGIDLGTGSCKSIVLSCDGRILGFASCGYSGQDDAARWKEQNPEGLISGITSAVRESSLKAGVTAENCQGVSLGGAMHTMMAVDSAGRPLTGIITWVDDRALPQVRVIRSSSRSGDIYQNTGCPVHWIYPLYKIIWLREERDEIFREARYFISAKEYVYWCLTGEYTVDPGIAAGTGLLHVKGTHWNDKALELAGIGPESLSMLQPSVNSLPINNAGLAAKMGIPVKSRVVLGSSDAVNSSLGAGALTPDQATCMIGSSGALRVISDHIVLDEQARIWCYALDEHHWLVGGAVNNGGLALTWLCSRVNQAYPQTNNASHILPENLIELAGQVPAGSGGLICLPFFAGERSPNWNMNARGVFWGLALDHNLCHISRAVLEGVAYRIRSVKDVLEKNGIDVHGVRASGGYTRSGVWLKIMANVINQPLVIPKWGETSSLGAAFWVLLANGIVNTFAELAQWVENGDTIEPDAAVALQYDEYYAKYRQIYHIMSGKFSRLTLN